ncbi:MAG: carboxy terminal-processing peptidase [Cyclobacteriaceae bacterium]|nr:carboxy terminal-processing peptidase [Cyclobacteriaceae bacterium]
MKKIFPLLFGFVFTLITVSAQTAEDQSKRLEIPEHYAKEAITVVKLLDSYHYRKLRMNDSLGNVVLNEYINSLDNSKLYFYKSDIETFDKYYRDKLDNLTKNGELNPAFDMYKVFEKRFNERIDYIFNNLIDYNYNFSVDEYYETDRDNEKWSESKEELNDIWRKLIKSQVLSMKLADKKPEDIKKTLKERYERLSKSVLQYRSEDVFQLFMNQVASSYDPHSNYFSPVTSDRFKQSMSLSLEGIGARLVTDNDYTKVVEVLPGGPAFKGKVLKASDRIISVGQGKTNEEEMVNVIGWRIDDVVKLIKGPKGTWVRLEILPAESGIDGATVILTMQREKIKLEDQAAISQVIPVKKDGRDYKIGIISIPSFYMDYEAYSKGDKNYNSTTRDVKKFLTDFQANNIDGVVIDLRNNGGGSLMEAIELTGLFITEGPVVQIRDIENKVEVGEDEDKSISWKGPLTVITNRMSASASEIFSGAIQDYKRGVIIGEQTYGKGTVQTVVDLQRFINDPDAELGHLKLTLQKFYRINGSSTQHKGVTPDVNLPSAMDADEYGESSEAAALPWDQIKSTKYKETGNISKELISQINERYSARLNNDVYLKELVEDVNEMKNSMVETKISLNENQRREENKQEELKRTQREKLTAVIDIEGKEQTDDIPKDDEYLREAIIILAEVINSSLG